MADSENQEEIVKDVEIIKEELQDSTDKFSSLFESINSSLLAQTNILSELLKLNVDEFEHSKRMAEISKVDNTLIETNTGVMPQASTTSKSNKNDMEETEQGGFATIFGANWLAHMLSTSLGVFSGGALLKTGGIAIRGTVATVLYDWATNFANDFIETLLQNSTNMDDEIINSLAETGETAAGRGIIGWAVLGRKGAILGIASGLLEGLVNKALDMGGITEEEVKNSVGLELAGYTIDGELLKSTIVTAIAAGATLFGPTLLSGITTGLGTAALAVATAPAFLIGLGAAAAAALSYIGYNWLESRKGKMMDQINAELLSVAKDFKPENEIGMVGKIGAFFGIDKADTASEAFGQLAGSIENNEVINSDTEEGAAKRNDIKENVNAALTQTGINPDDRSTFTSDKLGDTDLNNIVRIFEGVGDTETAEKFKVEQEERKKPKKLERLQEKYSTLETEIQSMRNSRTGTVYEPMKAQHDLLVREQEDIKNEIQSVLGVEQAPGAEPVRNTLSIEPIVRNSNRIEDVSYDTTLKELSRMSTVFAPVNVNNQPIVTGGQRTNTSTIINNYNIGQETSLGIAH